MNKKNKNNNNNKNKTKTFIVENKYIIRIELKENLCRNVTQDLSNPKPQIG